MQDRNFDDLADKFKRKVYGGLKGEIRLAVIWRDLCEAIPQVESSPALRILDVGAGLAQTSIRLARNGHQVVINDISNEMLQLARKDARENNVEQNIEWLRSPYQSLTNLVGQQFDLVLCHALLEWVVEPQQLVSQLKRWLAPRGRLSLSYYNRNALVYRNLIRGNFNLLRRHFSADPGSLTPLNPLYPQQVDGWLLEEGLRVQSSSGIRVFRDYVTDSRGGNAIDDQVLKMELEYSRLEPFKGLGRYMHYICT